MRNHLPLSRDSYALAHGSGPSLSPREEIDFVRCATCPRVVDVGTGEALFPTEDGEVCAACHDESERVTAENDAIEATWKAPEVAA